MKAPDLMSEEDEENKKEIKKIGKGATSIEYKVIDTRTSQVMCKKVTKSVDESESFKWSQNSMKKIETLSSIDHQCICRAIGFNSREKLPDKEEEDDDDEESEGKRHQEKTTVSLFFEYLPYKLKDYLKSEIMNNTLKTKIEIEFEFGFGMIRIHSIGLIHRDLKIDNIMLNSIFEAKIIDFDLYHVESEYREDYLTEGIGTLECMSSEMLNKENYDNKTDVYSYGIVLFTLFTL